MILLSACLLCGSSTALADNFAELSKEIVRNLPQLKAEEQRGLAAVESTLSENALAQPEVEYERLWNAGEGDNRWSVGISQSFEWPGLYNQRGRLADARRTAGELAAQARAFALRENVSEALVSYIAASKRVVILREVTALLQDLEKSVRVAFDKGETTIIDVNKATIEATGTAARLMQAEMACSDALAQLQSFGVNVSDKSVNATLNALEFPVLEKHDDGDYYKALMLHPDILSSDAVANSVKLEARVASKQRLPGFSLGYRHAFEDGNHFNGISLGVELPLWNRKHSVVASEANALAASFDRISVETSLKASVTRMLRLVELLQPQIASLSRAVEGTNNMALLGKAYKGGQMSLLDYLRESAYFLDARLQLLDLQSTFAAVTVKLNAIIDAANNRYDY